VTRWPNGRCALTAPYGALLLASAALGACTFEEARASTDTENTCSTDADCNGTACVMGMCISEDVEPLVLTLEVTPPRMVDGSEPQPVLLGDFRVDGTTERNFAMPRPYPLKGRVMNGDVAVATELKFVRSDSLPGVAIKAPGAMTSVEASDTLEAGAFAVVLLEDAAYAVQVTPEDGALPPLTLDYAGDGKDPLEIDYAALELVEQRFQLVNVPAELTLALRARSVDSGELISSRASVVDGAATLLFAPDSGDYRLEIVPENAYAELAGAAPPSLANCDPSAPAVPNLSVLVSDLTANANGTLYVALPALPERIAFAGSVELCPGADVDLESVGSLPIALRSSALAIDGVPAPLEASLAATTTASYDPDSRTLRFCIELFPGDYEVVVTPPSSMECAIFAEHLAVIAPAGMPDAAAGILLTLPDTTYLDGTLQTTALAPLGGASIEALALGISEGIELEAGDASVTRYNRSRQGTTDSDGAFSLPLDLGAYDVVFKPGADSGFGWLVNTDVKLARRDFAFDNRLELESPVLVQGVLGYSGGDPEERATLEGAEVRAFTVIEQGDTLSAPRAVQIGKATADADGRFMLLITPTMPTGW
jgi:hypothetical protein